VLVNTDEKAPIAQLLTFLEHGERLAHTCAKAQAALVLQNDQRLFLLGQARQEAMHAIVFRAAIAWLSPRYFSAVPVLPALEEYRKMLYDALSRKDLIETLLAEQVILEGLGQAILTRIEAGLVKRGAPYGRLRRMLLHQEDAHHGFGRRMLESAMANGETDVVTLQRLAQDYLGLTEQMVLALADLFASIAEDPSAWADDVKKFMPDWLSIQSMDDPI
jgi:GNAT superfamily N-acetyltransferase